MMDYRKFVEEETLEVRKTGGRDVAISALSGGVYSDYYVHQIDECSRMKGTWPVRAQATRGRHCRGNAVGQSFDTYTLEYTCPDGTKLFHCGRDMSRCHGEFASYAHGTKSCTGTIEFARIFPQSEQAGLKHYVVELQGEARPMDGE